MYTPIYRTSRRMLGPARRGSLGKNARAFAHYKIVNQLTVIVELQESHRIFQRRASRTTDLNHEDGLKDGQRPETLETAGSDG